jgi:hypothetical protein
VANDPRNLYRRWLLELWHGDLAVAAEVLTEDFTGHWPDREVNGRAALAELIRQTREMFSELRFELALGPLVEGDLVAARWTGVGRADGRETKLLGHDLLRVERDRFAEYWVASWTSA